MADHFIIDHPREPLTTEAGQLSSSHRDLMSRLGALLRRHQYRDRRILGRVPLRVDPEGVAAPWVLAQEFNPDDPFDALVTLFYLQGSIPAESAERHFSAGLLGDLIRLGLLAPAPKGGRVHSLVDIFTIGEALFITDPCRINAVHQPDWLRRLLPRAERVMYLGPDSLLLARGTVRGKRARVLDLCTGSGIHAILASADCDQVSGVDINPRALRFSRLNAALNGCPDIPFLEGDLYQPAGDGRFDLVLANPPFVATPDLRILFRDGGATGEDVLSRIVAGLPQRLEVGGMCQIVTDLAVRNETGYEKILRGWLGEDGEAWDILLTLQTRTGLIDYALSHLAFDARVEAPAVRAERFGAMMDGFRRAGLARFDFGLINIRRRRSGERGWYEERMLSTTSGDGLGEAIGEYFQRRSRFSDKDLFGEMMQRRPRLRQEIPVSRLHLLRPGKPPQDGVIRAVPTGSHWADEDLTLTPESCRLLGLCNGARSVTGIIDLFHTLNGPAPAARRMAVATQIRRFYEAGLVDLEPESATGPADC